MQDPKPTFQFLLPIVLVQILLVHFPTHIHIVTEFALIPLITRPRLVERAEYCLGIHTKGHLLRLNWSEERCLLLCSLLFFQFRLGFQGLFPFLLESISRFSRYSSLLLYSIYLSLDFGRFVFLQKGLKQNTSLRYKRLTFFSPKVCVDYYHQ